jgi:hypothetical protein
MNILKKLNISVVLTLTIILPTTLYAWTQNVQVDDAPDYSDQSAVDLFVDEFATIHMAWKDSRMGGPDVYYCQSTDGGQSFSANVQVNAEFTGVTGNNDQAQAVFARAGHIYVVWHVFAVQNIYITMSDDRGETWSNPVQVNQDINEVQRFQDVVVDSEGRVYVSWMAFFNQARGHDCRVARSDDYGQTFNDPVSITGQTEGDPCDCCAHAMAVNDNDEILFAWRNNVDNIRDVYFTKSTNSGVSFPTATRVDFNNWLLPGCPATGPTIRTVGDDVYIAWVSGESGPYRVWLNHSSDNGLNFDGMLEVSPGVPGDAMQNFPELAAGPDGIVWLTWQDGRMGNYDVWAALSEDYGTSFSESQRVNDDVGTTLQVAPVGDCDDVGNIFVAWTDERNGEKDIFFSANTPFVGLLNESITTAPNRMELIAYPNPFNPSTVVSYQLQVANKVNLDIYDVTGRLIESPLHHSWRDAGLHEVTFDGSELTSGIYILQLKAREFFASEKIVLLK